MKLVAATENQTKTTSAAITFVWDGVFPIVLYLASFAALTYPLLRSFSSRFFADGWDGRETLWGIWWIPHSVFRAQSPWFTSILHYPYGITLLGHNLSPFNGFIGIVLLRFLTLLQTHNFIVLFGFVVGGYTAFLLCKHVTGAYWPSLAGGAIFTFSNYHFAHAEGHLQLVSLEWMPLFLLLWCRLLEKPAVKKGIAAGAGLFLVLFCDYYYFVYCVIAGALMLGWLVLKQRHSFQEMVSGYARSLIAFTLTSLVLCGPLIFSLLLLNIRDPLIGAHADSEFSLDLPSLVIPGGHWRFANLTEFYWGQLPGNIHESSVNLGISVVLLAVYAWFKRSRLGGKLSAWYLVAGTFAILSLGPTLHVWGEAWPIPLPYRILRILIPPLKLTGTPVRMVIMVSLCCGVMAAYALKLLAEGTRSSRVAAGVILLLMFIEYLPAPIPQTAPDVPGYVTELARLPGDGAVLDLASDPPAAMYYQTIHRRPLAFGYISRIPRSIAKKDAALASLVADQNYESLCHNFGFEYVVKSNGEIVNLNKDQHCAFRPDALADLDRIVDAVSVKVPEHSFIRGNGPAIYQFSQDTKHVFTDFGIFVRYGGAPDLSNVITVNDLQLATIPDGQPIGADELADSFRRVEHDIVDGFRRTVRRITGFHGKLINLSILFTRFASDIPSDSK